MICGRLRLDQPANRRPRGRSAGHEVRRLAGALFPAVWGLALLAGSLASGAEAAAREVPGRIVLELTEAGARALRAGTLEVPLPAGGEALAPRLEPLFVSRTGPLSRFALLTFDAAAAGTDENRRWIATLTGSPQVLRGQSDVMTEMAALPDDPYLTGIGGVPPQKHLVNPGGLSLEASRAWPFVPAGREVVVAIIDSGVDWRHPDLGGANPPATGVLWRNEAEFTGIAGVDDDGNGHVDDVVGWDFVDLPREFPEGISVHPAEDDADEDNDPSDFAGHGTQAAGYVAALTDNAEGIAGAAPGARIMSLRAGWLSGQSFGFIPVVYMTYTARAIEYAARNGAKVINCSWDSDSILGMAEAVDLAINTYDAVIVASAGNQGVSVPSTSNPQYLGLRDDVLAVGGILFTGRKASASNYGTWVEIAAFYSGTSTTTYERVTGTSAYATPSGTSFAAPQVSGQVALLRLARPDASAAQVRGWITSTGQDLGELDPTYGTLLGGGLADYAASAQAAVGGWDGARGARRLTGYQLLFSVPPMPWTGSSIGFVGSEGLQVTEPGDGSPATGWTGGIPAGAGADQYYPLSVPWHAGGSNRDLLVWTEVGLLRGAYAPGDVPAGWPVTLPAGYGQPAAVIDEGGDHPRIYVPHGDGVLVIEPDGTTGVNVSSLDLPVGRIAVGQLDGDAAWEVAGIDAGGTLRVYDPDDQGGAATWSVEVGDVTAGPVITELDYPRPGLVVLAASDSASPDTLQQLHKIGEGGAFHETVALTGPPVKYLSVVGYGFPGQTVVAADEAGGIHPFEGGPPTLDAGGPLAGEVLSADLDGDYRPELIALRTDGTLLAWHSTGPTEPLYGLLPGFPRHFPGGAEEPPLIVDTWSSDRFVVVADTTGTVWSLPVGSAFNPAVWPGALGGPLRNAFLSLARATPVAASATLRRNDDGDLCWTGTGLDEYVSLRVRATESGTVLWEGAPVNDGCADVSAFTATGRVALEGLDRTSGWEKVATIDIAVTPAFRLAAPHPNPFSASTRLDWAGAAGEVRVRVFDVAGRLLLERRVNAGESGFTWDGADDAGRHAPPGVYFLRATDGAVTTARRVLKLP